MFWSARCCLLRDEGFFCSLDVLNGGLGICRCNFWKRIFNFFFCCKFFKFLVMKTLGRICIQPKKCWIRIRIKWIRDPKHWNFIIKSKISRSISKALKPTITTTGRHLCVVKFQILPWGGFIMASTRNRKEFALIIPIKRIGKRCKFIWTNERRKFLSFLQSKHRSPSCLCKALKT